MELHILLIFMIFAAIVAIEVKDLLSSVIAVGAVDCRKGEGKENNGFMRFEFQEETVEMGSF